MTESLYVKINSLFAAMARCFSLMNLMIIVGFGLIRLGGNFSAS